MHTKLNPCKLRSIYILLYSCFAPIISTAHKANTLYPTLIPNSRSYPDKEHSNFEPAQVSRLVITHYSIASIPDNHVHFNEQ